MKNKQTEQINELDEIIEQKALEIMQEPIREDNLKTFYAKLNQAKFGMSWKRDREMMQRINTGQDIRVITLISKDPQQRQEYIEMTMPRFKLLEEKEK